MLNLPNSHNVSNMLGTLLFLWVLLSVLRLQSSVQIMGKEGLWSNEKHQKTFVAIKREGEIYRGRQSFKYRWKQAAAWIFYSIPYPERGCYVRKMHPTNNSACGVQVPPILRVRL